MSANKPRPATPATRSRPTPKSSGRSPSKSGGMGGRTIVLAGLAVVVIVAVVIAVVSSGGDDSDPASGAVQETAQVQVDGAPLPEFPGNGQPDSAVGETAPTLLGESFDKSPVTIGPSGKPQVVMFLAHWCPHCQAEVPRVVDLARSGAFDGIDASAVATATSSQQPNYPPSAWLERERWPFPVLLDDQRSTAAQAYGLSAYPFFVFLDGNGTVVGRATSEIESSQLEEILDALRAGDELPLPSGAGGATSS